MGLSPQCYIPSFMEIVSLDLEKMYEESLHVPYMGAAAIIGHVASIMLKAFHFLVSDNLHTQFG